MKIDEIREEYTRGSLRRRDLPDDPYDFFGQWLQQAVNAGVSEPTAMVVSTIGKEGFPSSRVVLLKSFDREGFLFFTGYRSAKGEAIAAHPQVSLLFFWPELQRQVRVTGWAARIPEEESAAYFLTRPVTSRLGAWASEQSRPIPSREYLEERFHFYSRQFENREIPRPDHWGGFRITPHEMEFWQGRENRLHDRFRYSRNDGHWEISRLAP